MHDPPGDPAPDGLGAAARPRRPRRAIRFGAGLALLAGFAGAIYLAQLPLGRVGADAAVAGPGFYPVGSQLGGGVEVGQRAPDFIGPESGAGLLLDLDGNPVRLADFAGKPLWIVFWATWCIPCQQEAIDIRAAFHEHGEGLSVLAIDTQEPAASVRSYAQANHLDYAIGLDPAAAVMDLYRARGLPAHFFVDANGLVRARYFGQLTRALMEHYVAVITGD